MGNVCSAALGQAPARQAALAAGLSHYCVCTTVNKVCSSGMKAITLAAQDILLGLHDVIVAGGMENMSQVPYYLPDARFGLRMGDASLIDGVVYDGLIDPYSSQHMGLLAEACARKYNLDRTAQDAHAAQSYRRAVAAWDAGHFKPEVEPVSVESRGRSTSVTRDDECFRTNPEALSALRPAFVKDGTGTVTRGNASALSDGAAAVILMSAGKARQLGLQPIAEIVGFADAEKHPDEFTTAPALAIPHALRRADLTVGDVDVMEVNEAFSVVALANSRLMGVHDDRLNMWGGAVSLGHPVGCSGARIVVTLLNVLRETQGQVGVAGICNGGGGSTAMVVRRPARPTPNL